MGNAKRHHYLSQAYQQGFCARDGFLWIYDRRVNEFRRQKPQDTCVIGHYYSITDSEGQKDARLEGDLMQFVDDNGVNAIKSIRKGEEVTEEHRAKIATFCAYQMSRGPGFEKSLNHMAETLIRRSVINPCANREYTRALISSHGDGTEENSESDIDSLVEFARSGNYKINMNQSFWLPFMVQWAETIKRGLACMDWCFYRPAPKKTFITCDNPFVLLPPNGWQPGGILGYSVFTPGTTKIIPLARDLCLFMRDSGSRLLHRRATSDETREINLTIARNCYRYVLAKDETLLRSVAKASGISNRTWKPFFKVQ